MAFFVGCCVCVGLCVSHCGVPMWLPLALPCSDPRGQSRAWRGWAPPVLANPMPKLPSCPRGHFSDRDSNNPTRRCRWWTSTTGHRRCPMASGLGMDYALSHLVSLLWSQARGYATRKTSQWGWCNRLSAISGGVAQGRSFPSPLLHHGCGAHWIAGGLVPLAPLCCPGWFHRVPAPC